MAQSLPAAAAAAHPASRQDRLAWRTWVPWTLVVLAALIGLVSAMNVWVKRQALSTDNWTNASGQMLENDRIRGALSVYLVDQLYTNVDVPGALEQRLPARFKRLAAPLAGALQEPAVQATDKLLARPRVQDQWRNANRRAHKAFLALLNGDHGVLVSTNDEVVLNLRPLVKDLVERLGLSGERLQKLPPDAGQIQIMKGGQLDAARTTVKVIRALSYFLFFLVLGLYACAIYLARDRRRLLMGCGISVLLVGLLVLVVRRYAGDYLVNALTTGDDQKHTVNAVWAIGTQLLRNVGINTIVYGVGIIFAAWVAGPSRAATWLRRVLAPTLRDRPIVSYAAVTLALFVVLIAGPTDAQRIFPLLILFGFAYAGTEVLRRQTAREFPPTAPHTGASA